MQHLNAIKISEPVNDNLASSDHQLLKGGLKCSYLIREMYPHIWFQLHVACLPYVDVNQLDMLDSYWSSSYWPPLMGH